MRILVSAGEASGDHHAAELVEELRRRFPQAEFFGCAGPRLRQAGVEAVVRAEELAVVGIFEVFAHIPRIYGLFRRLAKACEQQPPEFAILTDAPDFHLRLARRLHHSGVPVFYLVAPQVWAWRRGRLRQLRRFVDHLLCIFPFEERFFRGHNVPATFVGHPLSERAKTSLAREEFLQKIGLTGDNPVVALLPGSRIGEATRHCGTLREAVVILRRQKPLDFVLAASPTIPVSFFSERLGDLGVHIVEGEAANTLGHADLALVASGTATVEAALLGTPMVVFYKVTPATWWVGRLLVRVPFYSMVNLLAREQIVPELIQHECTGTRLAEEALRLLEDDSARRRTREQLAALAASLHGPVPAAQRAAEVICDHLQIRGWSNVSSKPLTVS